MPNRYAAVLLFSLFLFESSVFCQNPVPVGSGSYAAFPPTNLGGQVAANAQMMMDFPMDVLPGESRPIPTNEWWTDMLGKEAPNDNWGGFLWAFPFMTHPLENGVRMGTVNRWVGTQWFAQIYEGANVTVSGQGFAAPKSIVSDWGDWSMEFLLQNGGQEIKTTIAHGIPYTWIELTGIQAQIQFAETPSYFSESGAVSMPFTGDHFGATFQGTSYGVFAPEGTQFSGSGNTLSVTFSGGSQFLVIGTMASASALATFYQNAYNVPRNTIVTWDYNEITAKLTTHWELVTENLKGGTAGGSIQCWLPHHWRNTQADFEYNGMEYMSSKGQLHCAEGRTFDITYDFPGILPMMPPPQQAAGAPNPYNQQRMEAYVTAYAGRTSYDVDTYNGTQDMMKFGHYLSLADQLGMTSEFNTLKNTLREGVTDWLTYENGETNRYFYYYPNWKALVGVNPAFGSEMFIDHHFHYGYLMYGAGILSLYDKDFNAKYGEMAKLVAREYASWIHNDTFLPFMRTLDPWLGHSYAGGLGNYGAGQNQESSSEAMDSWTGLYLLGVGLEEKEVRDAGIFGWITESRATQEYYFDQHGENFPAEYTHPICTMSLLNQVAYTTHFCGDDELCKFMIQFIPVNMGSYYLAEDTVFAKGLWAELESRTGGADFSGKSDHWQAALYGFRMLADPNAGAALFDNWYSAGKGFVDGNNQAGYMYYLTHSNRMLGRPRLDWHTSVPTGKVFYNAGADTYSFSAYNPTAAEITVQVFQGAEARYSFTVPALSLRTVTAAQATSTCNCPEDRSVSSGSVTFSVSGMGQLFSVPAESVKQVEILNLAGKVIDRLLPDNGRVVWRIPGTAGKGVFIARFLTGQGSVSRVFSLVR